MDSVTTQTCGKALNTWSGGAFPTLSRAFGFLLKLQKLNRVNLRFKAQPCHLSKKIYKNLIRGTTPCIFIRAKFKTDGAMSHFTNNQQLFNSLDLKYIR